MGKNEKTPITINEKEYFIEDLTDEQKVMFNHVADLDRKIGNAAFNMDQLQIGRDAFANMLVQSVEAPVDAEIVDEEEAA
tara:strand:+ start:11961 stop:12200 length:240 start_codon:yes stop_codon:yes gene_type:complete